jgi:two-component system, cell cycle sensor histidine kinase and response regulator CckA
MALDSIGRGEEVREELEEMVNAAERATALTAQLLAFSRRQVLQPEVLDLNEVVASMGKLVGHMIGHDVELVTVENHEPVLVSADLGQLEQVIANLAVNARDAMPEGGRLTVKIEKVDSVQGLDLGPKPHALLVVSDTGNGMSPETKAQAFEPFFTTKAAGNGFGLATVHGVVKQSGGEITVNSEVGEGTTFKIYLPIVDQLVAKDATKASSSQAPQSEGETILLVEDDVRVGRIVRNMLIRSGYRVLAADDAEDALTLLAEEEWSIDLLLSDLIMPGMGGRELAERVKTLQPQAAVLYMSGYTDDAVVRREVLDADVAFLQKPFGIADLVRHVRAELDRSKAA